MARTSLLAFMKSSVTQILVTSIGAVTVCHHNALSKKENDYLPLNSVDVISCKFSSRTVGKKLV